MAVKRFNNLTPAPTPTTLGGVFSLASVASKWLTSISTNGTPAATQPAFSDISGTATGSQIETNTNLSGTSVETGGKKVVVSNTNPSAGLAIVRGVVQTDGTLIVGEGFSSARNSLGTYQITFSSAFFDWPAVVITTLNVQSTVIAVASSTVGFQLNTYNAAGSLADIAFSFIAVGIRAS